MSEPTREVTSAEVTTDTPCQDHNCTAVIEDMVSTTPESEWDEAGRD